MALGRVLIVDDQAYARQAVGLLLSKAGYEVIEAEDGQKAIQIMNEEGNAYKVDTILCDLKMPNLDGPQAITYFQTHCPSIPIVIMTGEPDFVLTEVLKERGVTDYLVKPVSEKRLLEVVRVTVRLHGLRRKQS